MRAIKFRGQKVDSKEWVYGYLYIGIPATCTTYIIPEFLYNGLIKGEDLTFERFEEVIPESVGQFTGLHDKNGKEVYEGDILHLPRKEKLCFVEWHEEGHAFRLTSPADPKVWKSGFTHWAYNIGYTYNGEKCEVVGNLHETPELLTPQ